MCLYIGPQWRNWWAIGRANVSPPSLVSKKELRTEEVEHVFVNEEKRDLERDILPSREGNLPGTHPETLSDWVK